ncbi:ABC transporter permease [Nocardioides dubius]|uniref:ABC transporter permease n=1 Tax=Nocardioides dubius TaxID=317019 RepID=A0ABP4E6K1_9ACTN
MSTSTHTEPVPGPHPELGDGRRRRTLWITAGLVLFLVAVVAASFWADGVAGTTSLDDRRSAPSLDAWFGTDWLGRDVFARTLVGLRLSLVVGVTAATASALIALTLAAASAVFGRWVAAAVNWLVDLFLALPHLVLLILIAFALGGGTKAVVIAVALTHWPALTRVLQAQARVVVSSDYVALSRGFGRSGGFVMRRHVVRHLLPHFGVGLVLLFPHAILHEAALSFLGLGVDPARPAIGILLSESMRYLSSGMWWLAVLPGVCLLLIVKSVDAIGDNVRRLSDPRSHHQ